MTTPFLANDSVGIIDPFIFALLLVPLSYMGICLTGLSLHILIELILLLVGVLPADSCRGESYLHQKRPGIGSSL